MIPSLEKQIKFLIISSSLAFWNIPSKKVSNCADRIGKLISGNDEFTDVIKLKQAFGGTGYNEQIRHFPDFASRMYFMEQMND